MILRPRLDTLTALRFVAAAAVLIAHSFEVFLPDFAGTRFASIGVLGVDFFFVLSGFVLTWSRRAGRTALRFYWLRFSRVWPLHALTLFLVLVTGLTFRQGKAFGLLLNVPLLQAWSPDPDVYFGFNSPSWTLSNESFFYLVYPLLLLPVFSRLNRRALLGVAALLCGTMVLPGVVLHYVPALWGSGPWVTRVIPLVGLPQFALGVCLALLLERGWKVPMHPALWAAILVPSTVLRRSWGSTTGSFRRWRRPFLA